MTTRPQNRRRGFEAQGALTIVIVSHQLPETLAFDRRFELAPG